MRYCGTQVLRYLRQDFHLSRTVAPISELLFNFFSLTRQRKQASSVTKQSEMKDEVCLLQRKLDRGQRYRESEMFDGRATKVKRGVL